MSSFEVLKVFRGSILSERGDGGGEGICRDWQGMGHSTNLPLCDMKMVVGIKNLV